MVPQPAPRRTVRTGMVLAALLALTLGACGRVSTGSVSGAPPADTNPITQPSTPGGGPLTQNPVTEPSPEILPGTNNPPAGDSGGGDTPSLVGSTPQPKGLTTMSVSVVSTTSAFYPMDNKLINSANPIGNWLNTILQPYRKYNQRVTVITAKIMWLPVQNAVKYRVLRFADNDPKSHQLFYQVPDNKFMRRVGGYFFAIDGVLPVDTLSLGPNNGLHPYTTYHYVVQAYDASGNLVTQNEPTDPAATTTPLDEVANPQVNQPANGSQVKELDPLFTWYDRKTDPTIYGYKQGLEPDGFFIEASQQGLPIWATYKDGPRATIVRYGQKLGWHPRLNPFSQLVAIPLSPGRTYAWTVTAIKADAQRRAISKSSSQVGTFTVSSGATLTGPSTSLLPGLTSSRY